MYPHVLTVSNVTANDFGLMGWFILFQASSKYEAAKFRVDQKRAAFCIEKLQEYSHNMTLRPTGAE